MRPTTVLDAARGACVATRHAARCTVCAKDIVTAGPSRDAHAVSGRELSARFRPLAPVRPRSDPFVVLPDRGVPSGTTIAEGAPSSLTPRTRHPSAAESAWPSTPVTARAGETIRPTCGLSRPHSSSPQNSWRPDANGWTAGSSRRLRFTTVLRTLTAPTRTLFQQLRMRRCRRRPAAHRPRTPHRVAGGRCIILEFGHGRLVETEEPAQRCAGSPPRSAQRSAASSVISGRTTRSTCRTPFLGDHDEPPRSQVHSSPAPWSYG